MELIPCTQCFRHVRAHEAACPFCRATMNANPDTSHAEALYTQLRTLGRAAFVALGATLTTAACAEPAQGNTVQTQPSGGSGGTQVVQQPNADAGATDPVSARPNDPSGADAGSPIVLHPPQPGPISPVVAIYGAPAPAYGIPYNPTPSPALRYGAPPRPKK